MAPMWPYSTIFVLMTARNAGSCCIFSDKFFMLIAARYSQEQAFSLENASEKHHCGTLSMGKDGTCPGIGSETCSDSTADDSMLHYFIGRFGFFSKFYVECSINIIL